MASNTSATYSQLSSSLIQIGQKPDHMNHKKWKAYLKKMKRKKKRSEMAKEREENQPVAEEDPTDSEEEHQREQEEEERSLRQNLLWMQREREAQAAFNAKKEWEEKEKHRKEEIERKIKEEWAERERKEKEEQEAKEKEETEKRQKQKKLLEEATANENKEPWHNPIGPVQYSQEKKLDLCPFFKKTATCRFGEECSRYHDYPDSSTTILIPRMFTSIELEQSSVDALDADMSLEFEEGDLYQSFRDFYLDVVPEFKTVGTVVQVKVCCNYEPHLKGNVYVQYHSEASAHKAFEKFNARWYGGRQLTCIFVNIESWKAAICGLAFRKRCPKGKHCNFLHVFRNPGSEFSDMDHDRPASERRDNGSRRGYGERNGRGWRRHYHDDDDDYKHGRRSESVRSSRSSRDSICRPRYRSRSRERRGSHKDRSRSRSQDRGVRHMVRSRSRSKSKDRSSKPKHRSKSRSPGFKSPVSRNRPRSKSFERSSKSKHTSPSRSKHRSSVHRYSSKSPSREKYSKHKHKSRSPSKDTSSSKQRHKRWPRLKSPKDYSITEDRSDTRNEAISVPRVTSRPGSRANSRGSPRSPDASPSTDNSKNISTFRHHPDHGGTKDQAETQYVSSDDSSSSEDDSTNSSLPSGSDEETLRVSGAARRLKETSSLDVMHVGSENIQSELKTVSSSSSLPPPGNGISSEPTSVKAEIEKSLRKTKKKRRKKNISDSEEEGSQVEYVYVEKTKDSM
ncbi:hypothetical protein RRG08_028157 [Elysia crispata]|uniref:Uncharacterized protein n=1 Tax=Elysia crispata TaxID=231223 RepID=A0AAE1D2R7_9GAST|nr:hypothetical protein RRG08_028157 [Elysia crispata]